MNAERTTPSGRPRAPVVPLEAGAGPDNPPCPACGEPLFGWIDLRSGLRGPVSRCESCGLGVVGEPGSVAEALAALDRLGGESRMRIANRAGFAAWIGGAGWAGLEPDSLLPLHGRVGTPPGRQPRPGRRRRPLVPRHRHRDDVADRPQRLHLRPQRRPRRPWAWRLSASRETLAATPRHPDQRRSSHPRPDRRRPTGASGSSHEARQRDLAAPRAALEPLAVGMKRLVLFRESGPRRQQSSAPRKS